MGIVGTDHCMGNETTAPVTAYCCLRQLQPFKPSPWAHLLILISYTATAVLGITLNLVTLVALSTCKRLKKAPATCLVLNLAFADLLFCVVAIPTDAVSFLTEYHWNTSAVTAGICSLVGFIKYAAGTVDWATLAVIAVERYFKIVLGTEIHERFFHRRSKMIIIAALWILTLAFVGIFAKYGYNDWTCRCDWMPSDAKLHIMDRGKSHLIFMAVVVSIISFACARIWHRVHESATAILSLGKSVESLAEPSANADSETNADTQESDRIATDATRTDGATNEAEDPCVSQKPNGAVTAKCEEFSRTTITERKQRRSTQHHELKMVEAFHQRELALVKILAITTGSYVIMATPICVLNLADYCVQYPNLRHVFYSVYVWMYVLNFFIYVGAHPLYKKSCFELLKKVLCYTRAVPVTGSPDICL